ncbi:hypothetical protein VFPPC_17172 [Pochonia chlamydosporia 170]|uniref:Stc1 domain-containing protein n=1 Tax=Pochonia chlamydosporia 170 TaxID=1380566 RepID=A0A179EX11_METCM|nr:hypothetical protein VFPPC_17172 [Pochonia chlamydosporia 170]OAQ57459.1 hypothetical protein VFPPC_17172 [Pochonia chlamydosporia 170]
MSSESSYSRARAYSVSIVCARCGEKKPTGDFVSKRKSVGNTKNCLDCRNQRNSHVSSVSSSQKTFSAN